MAATLSEWRRPGSTCKGALVWNYRDLSPGAGWGLLDVFGRPKSSYYYLKRTLSPLGFFFSDEGANGLHIHIVNEGPIELEADLRISLYRNGSVRIHEQQVPIRVCGRGYIEISLDSLIGHFLDTTYAYRFGPPTHDVTVAELTSLSDVRVLARAFHFPAGMHFPRSTDVELEAYARRCPDGKYVLTVKTKNYAQAVHIDSPGFSADDNYFHLEPGSKHSVVLSPQGIRNRRLSGHVQSLNSLSPVKIALHEDTSASGATQ